jgi:hypothetical protein
LLDQILKTNRPAERVSAGHLARRDIEVTERRVRPMYGCVQRVLGDFEGGTEEFGVRSSEEKQICPQMNANENGYYFFSHREFRVRNLEFGGKTILDTDF